MSTSRFVRRGWIYPVTTILVGVAWYLAFLVMPGGVELLTKPYMLLADPTAIIPFLCFPLTSFLLGMAARPIFEWTGRGIAVITGLSMSFLGSILYVWLWALARVVIDVASRGSLDGVYDLKSTSAFALTCVGPFVALRYGLVTVPAAMFSGLVLHWASHPGPRPSPRPLAR